MNYFAHGGHEVETSTSEGMLHALTHQSAWVSLLVIALLLFSIYTILEKLGVKLVNRLLALIPVSILIAVLYMENNPIVTTVILSIGFAASFVLAFILLSAKDSKPQEK